MQLDHFRELCDLGRKGKANLRDGNFPDIESEDPGVGYS